jgi:SAM-dependent methyltransferase/aryl carrier-like protein
LPADDVTAGWNNSFTGKPYQADEMAEWVEATVARVLALRPRGLLEIGCGLGLLACRLRLTARTYHGTDFSASALRRARDLLGPDVELSCQHAADRTGIALRSKDVVVINSVAQYFPTPEYLAEVVDAAVDATVDGGAVFVGDARHLALLDLFHAAVATHRADPATPAARLLATAAARARTERELLVAPAYWADLAEYHPRVFGVDILLKRGAHDTEMNAFRYDVVLHVGPGSPRPAPARRVRWAGFPDAAVHLGGGPVLLTDVPNPRLARHAEAWRTLLAGTETTAERLRALAGDGVDPDSFIAWAESRCHTAMPCWWTGDGVDGTYEVLLRPAGDETPMSALLPGPGPAAPRTNHPYVQSPAPTVAAGASTAETILAVWRHVLDRYDIDEDANFLDVGGHSLTLVQVLGQLRATVAPDLQLVDLFQHTTVRALADHLTDAPGARDQPTTTSANRRRALRRQRDRRQS